MNKLTGIGSLPHNNPISAVQYSMKHGIPFLPQLTSLGENMIQQSLEYGRLERNHQALYPFIEKLIENKIPNFKIQIAGPSTCNSSSHIILKTIERFINIFASYKLTPIIFLDEPTHNLKFDLIRQILIELSKQGFQTGIHSCNQFDWQQMVKLPTTYISFDGMINPIPCDLKTSSKLIIGVDPFKILNTPKIWEPSSYDFISFTCGLAKFNDFESGKIYEELLKISV